LKVWDKTRTRQYVNLWQASSGSRRMYFEGMFEAHDWASKMRQGFIDRRESGTVRLLVCQFKRRGLHHWGKGDMLDVLNGVHGWKIVCEYVINKGVATKWIDRRSFSGKLDVKPTEHTASVAFPSERHQQAIEYVASRPDIEELCRKAPSRLAFRVALQRIDELKPPLSQTLAKYVWLWYRM